LLRQTNTSALDEDPSFDDAANAFHFRPPLPSSSFQNLSGCSSSGTPSLGFSNPNMTCFVCDLPILSHHCGLKWQGGNGVDDMLREQMERVREIVKQHALLPEYGN
jgi:hypothetical protein